MSKFFEENADAPVLVRALDISANSKAMQSGIQAARKAGRPTFLFAQEPGTGAVKTVYSNFVPEDAQKKGLNAVDWNKHVSDKLQGRGGGKPDGAQGVGEATRADVDEAVRLADEFFRLKVN